MLGAIEAGGTKFVCCVGDDSYNIIDRVSFPTDTPQITLEKVYDFFDKYNLKSMAIGSFGPIEINPSSSKYGYVTTTPKLKWRDYDFLGKMKSRYSIPIGWTTDVNIACLGEYTLGSAKDVNSAIYITVGTGIGAGAISRGRFVGDYGHSEMGHILVKRHPEDSFEGWCPYHKDCLEGLAAGPAIEKRYSQNPKTLPPNHQAWSIEGYYLAQALVNYTLVLRPEKIILGGGVMKQDMVLDKTREYFSKLLNGYVSVPKVEDYIVRPLLGDDVGIIGGLILADRVLKKEGI